MKNILTCLLSMLLYATTMFAQKPADAKVRTRPVAKEQLIFTTSIVNRCSCGPNHLGLDLKLSFKNTGKDPVILTKKILVGSIVVSRNLDDAVANKYVLSLRYSDFAGAEEPGFGFYPPTDLSEFVLLHQGEVYEFEESVSIPTHLAPVPGARPFPEIHLSDGTNLLQIAVGTWPYIANPKPIREKWKGKGRLWTQGLLSEPMPFMVDRSEPITKCPPC